jgi:hypothetical protein
MHMSIICTERARVGALYTCKCVSDERICVYTHMCDVELCVCVVLWGEGGGQKDTLSFVVER